MKVIDKIQIRYFRSIKDEKVHNINEVNVFSGSNDSGKSNILRALNLFFNGETSFQNRLYFENDFSKERLEEVRKESIKGRQFIAVKIFFIAPSGHKNLPNKFYVEKMWDRKGNLLNTADNVIYQFKKGKTKAKTEVTAKTALSRFINSIYYQYIPAVRSPVIFDNLLGILQELIVKKNKNNTKVAGLLSDIEKEFNSFTGKIGSEFQKVSGVQSSVRIPSEFQDIFKAFFIDTNTGNFSIPLNFRGDGIQMRYIPVIMDYIARNSRGIHIWGFDEPENSTEYKLCSQMAEDFKNRFSKNAQIFIATHSFHFTTLKGENVSRYRVFKDAQGINSSVLFVNKDDQVDIFNQGISEKINEELGILDLHKDIANEYKEWQENKNVWLNEFKRIEKQLCDDDKLPIIFVEGKTDKIILENAWKKRRDKKNMPFKIVDAFDCYFLCNTFSRGDIFKNYPARKFIGMLDFDDAYDKWEELRRGKKKSKFIDYETNKKKGLTIKYQNESGYIFLLPVPDIRDKYADVDFGKSYLSIELLFSDELLKDYVEEIPVAGGVTLKKMKDSKKNDFSMKVKNFKREDFDNFENMLNIIEKILNE